MVCLLQNVKDKHAVPGPCSVCVCARTRVCIYVLYMCVLSVLVHSLLPSLMQLSTDDSARKQPLWLIAATLVS